MNQAIETYGLKKRYGDHWALKGIDLSVKPGSVYGLLGPNGAGKTTTVGILTTLLKPDEGEARVMGFDVRRQAAEVRSRISLTGQYASVDEDLTGLENLILIGRLYGFSWKAARARARELLEAFDLSSSALKLVRTYSGGMRRRLDVAAGLVVHSDVIFLDEPTTGLDPRSRNQVWEIVRAIAEQGATVLLTTQYMEEADRLAHRLAVIDHGKVIAEGTGRDLKARVGANSLHIRLYSAADAKKAGQELRKQKLAVHTGSDAFSLVATIDRDDRISKVFHALSSKGLRMAEFAVSQPSMDEVFFALTGHPAENETGEPNSGESKTGAAGEV
ncbi:MAG: ATP-binding cassette domain-containing protein [Leptospiraceae bacterium]|nr:ATP-binding cassette domain-containing protein [Leptospiraceae bacterium]